ncbi:MAG: hypothetical protein LBC65_05195 [Oscillospiraceae bacterium]|jgi:hypothetical protein|nr:hypothetical protein [Oscillospiraceae bacterium]
MKKINGVSPKLVLIATLVAIALLIVGWQTRHLWMPLSVREITPSSTSAIVEVTPSEGADVTAPVESLTPSPVATPVKASFIDEFYPEATTASLAPIVAEEFCSDFADITEPSPYAFGKENYNGRRVTVSNDVKTVEIYLTATDGGVWACVLTVPFGDPNRELPALRARLAEWTMPDEPAKNS